MIIKKSAIILSLLLCLFITSSCSSTDAARVTVVSAKIVRLDGSELEFSQRPIPRKIKFKFALDSAVSDEADRAKLEDAIALKSAAGNEIAGSWFWDADYLAATFTPSSKLNYRTEYAFLVDDDAMPAIKFAKSLDPADLQFTTLTEKDLNGDGYADIVVGSDKALVGSIHPGRAYVFDGSAEGILDCDLSDPSCVPSATITGAHDSAHLGISAAIAGDVNADGFEDVIVGSHQAQVSGITFGQAYVLLGSAAGIGDCNLSDSTCSPSAVITGGLSGDSLGYSVARAGDVDADGYDDVIVGAYKASVGGATLGQAYVLHGSAKGILSCDLSGLSATCNPDTELTGPFDRSKFGISVSYAGDVNADGFDDVIIGATSSDATAKFGHAYVFLGSKSGIGNCNLQDGSCAPDTIVTGATDGDVIGGSVSTAGDLNGDGYDDVVIGADVAPFAGIDEGQAYVFYGSASGIRNCDLGGGCTPDATLSGISVIEWFGSCVSTAGDVDADGLDDLIIGAKWSEVGTKEYGGTFIFLGSSLSQDMTETDASSFILGPADGAELGSSVSAAGDVNGDGYSDILIGAQAANAGGLLKGQTYVFTGSASGIPSCAIYDGCDLANAIITGASDDDMLSIVR